MKNILKISFLTLLISYVLFANVNDDTTSNFKVNKLHLDYLYQEISIDNKALGIIHIYCDYPSYKFVEARGEGYACVDDAARAGLFYLEYFKAYRDSSSLKKSDLLTNFVLYMQAQNGFFYNFLQSDNTINKTYRTSVAEPNWWSWRALWLLSESYKYYNNRDTSRAQILLNSINKCIKAIKRNIPGNLKTKVVDGVLLPEWLPAGSGADQSALLIIVLTDYYKFSGDKTILGYIRSLAKGIMMMQVKDESSNFNGAFLSWENTWHSWGNLQSYALLKSYQILKDEKVKASVLKELDLFFPYLLQSKFLSNFNLRMRGSNVDIFEKKKFPQIAYDIRPMVFALLEAFKKTGESKYAKLAGDMATWYLGNNPAKQVMYNVNNGIVFDGIIDEDNINMNSGAESTIETLWTLLKISQNKIAVEKLQKSNYYNLLVK
jgi:hypothetical protein